MSDRTAVATAPQTTEQIRGWLLDRVAHYLGRPSADLAGHLPLSGYGRESVYTFALCADIERVLRVPVHPTVIWNIDTVDGLAAYLGFRSARR